MARSSKAMIKFALAGGSLLPLANELHYAESERTKRSFLDDLRDLSPEQRVKLATEAGTYGGGAGIAILTLRDTLLELNEAPSRSHWRVKFMRRGMEPPRPFGKTEMVVCALSREDAKEVVPYSYGYPVTATKTQADVSFGRHCSCGVE